MYINKLSSCLIVTWWRSTRTMASALPSVVSVMSPPTQTTMEITCSALKTLYEAGSAAYQRMTTVPATSSAAASSTDVAVRACPERPRRCPTTSASGLRRAECGPCSRPASVEGLQLRVERAGELEVARRAVVRVRVALELEHVAQVVGARESEARGRPRRARRCSAPPAPSALLNAAAISRAGQVLAGDADRLADELSPALKMP